MGFCGLQSNNQVEFVHGQLVRGRFLGENGKEDLSVPIPCSVKHNPDIFSIHRIL